MISGFGEMPDEKGYKFICLECEKTYSISQQFEGKPICINCINKHKAPANQDDEWHEQEETELQQSDEEFLCLECGGTYSSDLQFEDKPICINCIDISNAAEVLKAEQDKKQKFDDFLCLECGNTYSTDLQFEDKPICINCVSSELEEDVTPDEEPAADDMPEPEVAEAPATIEQSNADAEDTATEEQLVDSEEAIATEEPVIVEEPIAEAVPAAIEEPAVEETLAAIEETVAEQAPAAIEETTAEQQPAATIEETAVEQQPAAVEDPVDLAINDLYFKDLDNTQQLSEANDDNNIAEDKQMSESNALKITDADWVNLPAGNFLMGSALDEEARGNDERHHRVEISAIKMMSKPVTFEQYEVFCSETGKALPSDEGWGRDIHPVINVSYWDAVDYAKWLSEKTGWKCRLPTEAEWEYACRAADDTQCFNVGDTISCSQANYDGLYFYKQNIRGLARWRTLPSGSFQANSWGLYDMHGNVWEWCASEYDFEYSGLEMMDASFDRLNREPRVLRGGSWHSRPAFLRSACRYRHMPDNSSSEWGFRLVRIG